jgi:hypothetical protein
MDEIPSLAGHFYRKNRVFDHFVSVNIIFDIRRVKTPAVRGEETRYALERRTIEEIKLFRSLEQLLTV